MLEKCKVQAKVYENCLISLCKDSNCEECWKWYRMYSDKLAGVLDMLSFDNNMSLDEYLVACNEIQNHFEHTFRKCLNRV